MKNKLIRKCQNAGKLNYNWSNNDDDLNTQYNRAWNFVHAYMRSPGFQERLKKHLNDMSYKNEGIYNDYDKDRDWSVRYPVDHNYKTNITTNVQKPAIRKDNSYNASYEKKDNIVSIDDNVLNFPEVGKNLEHVLSHELGHYLDDSIQFYYNDSKYKHNRWDDYVEQDDGTYKAIPRKDSFTAQSIHYADSYPIFRNSKSWKANESKIKSQHPDSYEYFSKNPYIYYGVFENAHDGMPNESYADLIEFRDMLYRSGIFNSLKQDSKHPFSEKHLNRFKEIYPNFRLFDNFKDSDIIKMMNTVAQNSNQETQPTQEESPLYVKQGGIIKAQNAIPYGFRIPYRANHLSFDNTPRIGTYTMPFPNKNLSKTSWLDLYSNEEEKRNGVTRTIETTLTSGPEIPYAYDPEYGYPEQK